MAAGSSPQLEQAAQATGMPLVYLAPRTSLDPDARVHIIDGRPVTAIAAHPTADDLLYLTTGHPELLASLADQASEWD
jgi:hypothetical protein